MEDVASSLLGGPASDLASILAGVLAVVTALVVGNLLLSRSRRSSRRPNLPPAVPGLPLIGNLHQLKDKKPHQTFAKWAEIYGPIYTIKTGASTMVVLNSTEVAKEAMVTRFSSMSTRKLSKALTLLTSNKAMVATSDYGEFHKMVKRYILTSLLGASAQKSFRAQRDTMISNVLNILHSKIEVDPVHAINFREPFEAELFRLTLKESLGEDVKSIYVDELGRHLSKKQMFDMLVMDPMAGAIDVDWRDFFPYLRWIPNKSFEMKIQGIATRMKQVTRALIREQKKRIALGEERNCYLDALLKEKTLTEEQLISLVWEAIIEASDTTLVVTEWAMFELARNQRCQDQLYAEIREVCGTKRVTEEDLAQLPYLNAVFHESLRRYSPAPIVPLRYAHEDTQVGGYDIQEGSEIALNLYGCNMNKNEWENPEQWKPERFLDSTSESMDLHKTMAFGGGKRVCAGALQAMLISCTAIARLVQEFEWRPREGEEENFDTLQLTTRKLEPLHAYITPRETITSMSSTP